MGRYQALRLPAQHRVGHEVVVLWLADIYYPVVPGTGRKVGERYGCTQEPGGPLRPSAGNTNLVGAEMGRSPGSHDPGGAESSAAPLSPVAPCRNPAGYRPRLRPRQAALRSPG